MQKNPARCSVRLFKLYLSLCPSDASAGAFYLSPLKHPRQVAGFPFHRLVRKLSKAIANVQGMWYSGIQTNHSLRATAATRLYLSGIDEQLVMERTGHRSTEGIRSYKCTTMEQKEVVSDILSNIKGSANKLEANGK